MAKKRLSGPERQKFTIDVLRQWQGFFPDGLILHRTRHPEGAIPADARLKREPSRHIHVSGDGRQDRQGAVELGSVGDVYGTLPPVGGNRRLPLPAPYQSAGGAR